MPLERFIMSKRFQTDFAMKVFDLFMDSFKMILESSFQNQTISDKNCIQSHLVFYVQYPHEFLGFLTFLALKVFFNIFGGHFSNVFGEFYSGQNISDKLHRKHFICS